MIFMLGTTLVAMLSQLQTYWAQGARLLLVLSGGLFLLALCVIGEAIAALRRQRKG